MDYETAGVVVAFTMGLAPAMAIVWTSIAKYTADLFKSADETAITEKSNPNLITK